MSRHNPAAGSPHPEWRDRRRSRRPSRWNSRQIALRREGIGFEHRCYGRNRGRAEGGRWNNFGSGERHAESQSFIREKEKQLIVRDGTAERAAEIVLFLRGLRKAVERRK